MIKEEVIYEEDQELYQRRGNVNQFVLSDQIRNNLNKRLPRGFALVKINELPKSAPFKGDIQYVAIKRQPRVASQDLSKQFLAQPIAPQIYPVKDLGKSQVGVDKAGLRFSQLPEGKSKQGEKIKNILQRFRRHQRYPALAQYLQRMGFMNSFLQIEAQNKKNIHTIDSFKDRVMFVFKHLREYTYEEGTLSMINQLIDQFLFHVEQARKLEFENSLNNIQKSIDKVTREISEIKECGNYYYRKKKRNQKNYDEKEMLYVAELIKGLTKKDLVGIMEIIEEKPFQQIATNVLSFDLSSLKPKKIRQIEFYVKKKLSNYFKSRERKRQKMSKNKREEDQRAGKLKKEDPQLQKSSVLLKEENKEDRQIGHIFQYDDEPIKQEENPKSIFGFDNNSLCEFDDFLADRQSDVFYGGQRSVQNPSIMDRNQKRSQSNIEFENPNLQIDFYNGQEEQDYDSSDSSMITDEQDSDY